MFFCFPFGGIWRATPFKSKKAHSAFRWTFACLQLAYTPEKPTRNPKKVPSKRAVQHLRNHQFFVFNMLVFGMQDYIFSLLNSHDLGSSRSPAFIPVVKKSLQPSWNPPAEPVGTSFIQRTPLKNSPKGFRYLKNNGAMKNLGKMWGISSPFPP